MNYQKVIKKMSIEDKIALCSGKDFWHTKDFEKYDIPSIMMTDGPHGLRKQREEADMLGINDAVAATCFPTAVTTGSTWDRGLISQVAEAIGEEAKVENVPVVLGPGANIKRNPLCGRNFEYFSEDPYLTGEMGSAFVDGMQKTGVGTSLKHFAVNSQEYKRFSSDSQIDERTLREVYLTGFEKVVKQSQPKTVMTAYPKLNGTYCSDNTWLLKKVLRGEWGFKGMVVTDWGGMNDRIASFQSGCDLSMPGGSNFGAKEALEGLKSGALEEEDVNKSVERVLKVAIEGDKVLKEKKSNRYDVTGHQKLAEKAASQGAVLLKNEEDILPLDTAKKVVLIGHMAKEMRYQGAGSSHINPTKLVQVLDCMKDSAYVEGCDAMGDITLDKCKEVEKAASEADIAIVFAGLTDQYESEGFDRENMAISKGHNRMIEAALKGNKNTIVVLMGGSAMLLPWFNRVKAILYMGLSGQSAGQAVADLLTGKVNPSGKLAETWPMKDEDVPSFGFFAGERKNAQYREGIYVGYRYYDKTNMPVRFPFGYGMSYTKFEYANIQVKEISNKNNKEKFFGNDRYEVSAEITNVGSVPGAEVAQLYVGMPTDGIYRAKKELKGFEKVFLQPGESKEVSFILDDRSFAIYQDGWKIPTGEYQLIVAASSVDIRLTEEIKIKVNLKGKADIPVVESKTLLEKQSWQKGSWYENPIGQPKKADWEKIMGKKMVDDPVLKRGAFEINHTLMELKDFSLLAKIMVSSIEKGVAKSLGTEVDYTNPEFRMSATASVDCSMRGMVITSCGQFSENMAHGIVEMANGHTIRGIRRIMKK